MKNILDHSIESDQRLLEYTDDIFNVAKHSPGGELKVTPIQTSVTHQQTQTEICPAPIRLTPDVISLSIDARKLNSELDEANRRVQVLENELSLLKRPCTSCGILKEEASNMIATIRTLEQQLQERDDRSISAGPFGPVVPLIPVNNRFSVLQDGEGTSNVDHFTPVRTRKTKRKINKPETGKQVAKRGSEVKKTDLSKEIPFKSIAIIGDSHARHIANMVKEQLRPRVTVSGMCKPGAGLLPIASSAAYEMPSPHHCNVLVAGTNDVAAGREDVIYRHMDNLIKTLSSNAKLVVSTLPHRHDLAPHSLVNKNTRLLNNYIAELCGRHEGVELMDFNTIRRPGFTAHGMHLNMRGKRELARLIVRRLSNTPTSTASRQPLPGKHATADPSTRTSLTTEPTLSTGTTQQDTYADVVKQLKSPSALKNTDLVFLGSPPRTNG